MKQICIAIEKALQPHTCQQARKWCKTESLWIVHNDQHLQGDAGFLLTWAQVMILKYNNRIGYHVCPLGNIQMQL